MNFENFGNYIFVNIRIFFECVISLRVPLNHNLQKTRLFRFLQSMIKQQAISTHAVFLHNLFSRLPFSEAILSLFCLKVKSSTQALYVILRNAYFKGAPSGLGQFFSTGRPLKMMKNELYFNLKALRVPKIFKFLSQIFGQIKKRLD